MVRYSLFGNSFIFCLFSTFHKIRTWRRKLLFKLESVSTSCCCRHCSSALCRKESIRSVSAVLTSSVNSIKHICVVVVVVAVVVVVVVFQMIVKYSTYEEIISVLACLQGPIVILIPTVHGDLPSLYLFAISTQCTCLALVPNVRYRKNLSLLTNLTGKKRLPLTNLCWYMNCAN